MDEDNLGVIEASALDVCMPREASNDIHLFAHIVLLHVVRLLRTVQLVVVLSLQSAL